MLVLHLTGPVLRLHTPSVFIGFLLFIFVLAASAELDLPHAAPTQSTFCAFSWVSPQRTSPCYLEMVAETLSAAKHNLLFRKSILKFCHLFACQGLAVFRPQPVFLSK